MTYGQITHIYCVYSGKLSPHHRVQETPRRCFKLSRETESFILMPVTFRFGKVPWQEVARKNNAENVPRWGQMQNASPGLLSSTLVCANLGQ